MDSETRERVHEILYAYFNESLPLELEEGIHNWLANKGHQEEKYAILEELWYKVITESHHTNEKLLECYQEITRLLDFPSEESASVKPTFRFPWTTAGKVATVFILAILKL